jgi:hypothetical protein
MPLSGRRETIRDWTTAGCPNQPRCGVDQVRAILTRGGHESRTTLMTFEWQVRLGEDVQIGATAASYYRGRCTTEEPYRRS